VFNVKAEGLAFFDDDEDLNGKNIFPSSPASSP
jgi:hypothetical protein